LGSIGICPETNSRLPARMAGEYAPIALGASGEETTLRVTATTLSGGLGYLARAQAARADPNAPHRTVDERLHRLQVRLEPPRTDVVGVGNRPADLRPLVTDFTALGHNSLNLQGGLKAALYVPGQTPNCSTGR